MKITNNIISNNCTGARIMRRIGIENANPFCWTVIDFDAIKTVLNTYNDIDWLNFRYTTKQTKKQVFHGIVVDGKFTIWFPHVKQDNNHELPHIEDIDVHIKDVKTYLSQTYKRRVSRMLNTNLVPSFVINEKSDFQDIVPSLTRSQMLELDKMQDKYEICFAVQPENKDIQVKNKIEQANNTDKTAETALNTYRREKPQRTEQKPKPNKPTPNNQQYNGRLSMAFYR